MKRLILVAMIGVSVLSGLEWQKRRRSDQVHELPTVSGPPTGFHQPREDVGWVFGRLVGIPGAEKPLSGGNALSLQPLPGPQPSALQSLR
ncbi:MAG: hypothetical protein AB7U20_08775 [Planctomycetaceae bacterium]